MLACLRFDAVIGGDDQQREIDPRCSCEHGVDKALMAGNIHEPERLTVRDRKIGEAEIYGDAARLLFLQSITFDTRQRFDENRLAVIDVPGGADNHATLPRFKWLAVAQFGQRRHEFVFVGQTAKIEDQCSIRCAAEDRPRQSTQGRRQPVQRTAA